MSLTDTLNARIDAALHAKAAAGVVAMVADRNGVIFEAARGHRSFGDGAAMTLDSVMWLASMTKVVTTVAVMQCVEHGQLELDAPASSICPEIGDLKVRERFRDDGTAVLRDPRTPITLRHLLSHSSGLAYELFHPDTARELEITGKPNVLSGSAATFDRALVADPGSQWIYAPGIDWAGRMLEAVTGEKLGAHFKQHIFEPLGMKNTTFRLNAAQTAGRASMHARLPDGGLMPIPFELPTDPEFEMGGHALFGTAPDYLRFARMLLGDGVLEGQRILSTTSVAAMRSNQIGSLAITPIPSAAPDLTNEVHLFPGVPLTFGLGVLINQGATAEGRSPGSFTWMGLSNCYFWIDPTKGITGLLMAQLLPFYDAKILSLYSDFERAVNATVRHSDSA